MKIDVSKLSFKSLDKALQEMEASVAFSSRGGRVFAEVC